MSSAWDDYLSIREVTVPLNTSSDPIIACYLAHATACLDGRGQWMAAPAGRHQCQRGRSGPAATEEGRHFGGKR